ncbi:glycosyltransferase family 4 protein [Vibrio breoganii]
MKILHIVGDSKFGGGSVIISNLVSSQISQGYDVYVLTTDEEFISHIRNINGNVIKLECIHRNYNLFTDLLGVFRLSNYLYKNRFDFVHTHTTKAGFIGRISAKLANCKNIIHTVHGFPFSESSSPIKIKVFSFLEQQLFKISDKVVFVSEYHLSWARKLKIVNQSKAVAIKNGIEIREPDNTFDILKLVSDEAAFRIVYVGRLVKEKGLLELIEAFKLLLVNYPYLHLILVGNGPDRVELERASDNCRNIHFTGFVQNAVDYLVHSNVFVLPSFREGLSISAIEAQAYGVPSVLSDIGGNVEVSNNGADALLFTTGSISSLSNEIKRLIDDENLRQSLSERAKLNYQKNFTNDAMVSKYAVIYNELKDLV